MALSFRDLGARRGWVVSTTPRPLYLREIPGTHCIGGWVGPRPFWTCAKNLALTGIDAVIKVSDIFDFTVSFKFINVSFQSLLLFSLYIY
jgi:hypothetical protein